MGLKIAAAANVSCAKSIRVWCRTASSWVSGDAKPAQHSSSSSNKQPACFRVPASTQRGAHWQSVKMSQPTTACRPHLSCRLVGSPIEQSEPAHQHLHTTSDTCCTCVWSCCTHICRWAASSCVCAATSTRQRQLLPRLSQHQQQQPCQQRQQQQHQQPLPT